MTSSSDDTPLAPRRSLGPPGYAAATDTSTNGPSTQRQPPVSPTAPSSAETGGGGATATSTIDKKAERDAARSQRKAQSSRPRAVRRAKLRLVRVDPWSVTKTAFLLSIAFGIMCVVAVFLIFSFINASGLWDSINSTIQGLINQKPADAFDITQYVAMSRVMGITMLIAAVDVVLITALAILGAFLYNMSASLLGGVEVTLAEDLK